DRRGAFFVLQKVVHKLDHAASPRVTGNDWKLRPIPERSVNSTGTTTRRRLNTRRYPELRRGGACPALSGPVVLDIVQTANGERAGQAPPLQPAGALLRPVLLPQVAGHHVARRHHLRHR